MAHLGNRFQSGNIVSGVYANVFKAASYLEAAINHFEDQLGSLQWRWREKLKLKARNDDLRSLQRKHTGGRRRQTGFGELAGMLYLEARNKSGTVRREQLLEIAKQLDDAGYKPPSKYLQPAARICLTRFNSAHANSSTLRPIKSWAALVNRDDQKLITGMRRVLQAKSALLREES